MWSHDLRQAMRLFRRELSSVLFQVAPWDPATLMASVALPGAATMIASYLPARRAARVDQQLGSEADDEAGQA